MLAVLRHLLTAVAFAAGALVGIDSISAATVTRIDNGRPGPAILLLQGTVVAGDFERMSAVLEKLPHGTVVSVILDSPGGLVSEGLKLGTLFYRVKAATFVKGGGAICYSACALAFLGGRDARSGKPMRVKMSGGQLGFHQFRRTFDPHKVYSKADYEAEVARAQQITGEIVAYLRHIGEDLSKLQLMLRAPNESMNVISNEEALQRGFQVLDEATGRLIEAGSAMPQQLSALTGRNGATAFNVR